MDLNRISEGDNTLIQADVSDFLVDAKDKNLKFDLAVVDPPSFSTSRSKNSGLDISRDHPLLLEATINLMRAGATIFFSTNHQDFQPKMDDLNAADVREITATTIPEDYVSKKKRIHRCWKIIV